MPVLQFVQGSFLSDSGSRWWDFLAAFVSLFGVGTEGLILLRWCLGVTYWAIHSCPRLSDDQILTKQKLDSDQTRLDSEERWFQLVFKRWIIRVCNMSCVVKKVFLFQRNTKATFICVLFPGLETWHKSHYLTGKDFCCMAGQVGAVCSVPSPLYVYWSGHVHPDKCKESIWKNYLFIRGQGSIN